MADTTTPERFSTTIGWPSFFDTNSAKVRAITSMLPPGEAPTNKEMGRTGQVSACREWPANPKSTSAVSARASKCWKDVMTYALHEPNA
jgi:hypothetical protein